MMKWVLLEMFKKRKRKAINSNNILKRKRKIIMLMRFAVVGFFACHIQST